MLTLDRTSITVVSLAVVGPIGIDLVVPAIPSMKLSIDGLLKHSVFSFYLLGLGLGQILCALLLQVGMVRSVLYPGITLYILSAGLLAFLELNSDTLLALRFISGLGAGILYFICFVMVSGCHDEDAIARLYSQRSVALLVSVGISPFIAAGILATAEWMYIFLFQMIYGLMLLLLLRTMKEIVRSSTSRLERARVFPSKLSRAVLGYISFSLILYLTISTVVGILQEFGYTSSYVFACVVLIMALCYQIGVLIRRYLAASTLAKIYVPAILLCIVLTLTSINMQPVVVLASIVAVYITVGMLQSIQAAALLSNAPFHHPLWVGVLTAFTLFISFLCIELVHMTSSWTTAYWLMIGTVLGIIMVSFPRASLSPKHIENNTKQ